MSIKVAKNNFTRKMIDFETFKNCLRMWKIWTDLDKIIVAKGFKSCPKSDRLPNLVTLWRAN